MNEPNRQMMMNVRAEPGLLGGGRIMEEMGPSIKDLWRSVRAAKWWILALTALGAWAAIYWVNQLAPEYRATTTILLENTAPRVVSIDDIYTNRMDSREFYQTQAEFMKSREVGDRVVKELKLATNPLFDPRQQTPGWLVEWIRNLSKKEQLVAVISQTEAEEAAIAKFQQNLTIAPIRLSQMVEIQFDAKDPELAATIANRTAAAYVTAELDARFKMQKTASVWLSDRLLELKEGLEASERNLQTYREEIGLLAIGSDSTGGASRQLDSSADRLIAARVERSQLELVYGQVARGSPNRYDVPAVANHPAVMSARAAETLAERKLADAMQALGPLHPAYRSAASELDLARENTRRQSESVIASIGKQLEVARNTERALESTVASTRGAIQDLNRKEGRLTSLEREVTTNQQLYQTFFDRMKQTNATADFRSPIARIVDSAVPPKQPIRPQKRQIVMGATLMSLLLSALLVIGIDQTRNVIRATSEIRAKLGESLIAAVPGVRHQPGVDVSTLQYQDPHSHFAESVRTVVSGVRLALVGNKNSIVGFTASLPDEGKSTLALNFAIEEARTRRVLIVDLDLRRSMVAQMLGLPEGRPGLRELMAGATLDECLFVMPQLKIWVLPAGFGEPLAHDVLLSAGFEPVLKELRNRFDTVVFDTPPLELVSDALSIGRLCDGMVFVVKAGSTPVPMARNCIERLRGAGANIVGVVLNFHDFRRASKLYGEYPANDSYGSKYYRT